MYLSSPHQEGLAVYDELGRTSTLFEVRWACM